MLCFFFFKQKTAYEMRISDWSSDVCSSDLFGEINSLEGIVEAGEVATPFGTVAADGLPDGAAVQVLIRPEALHLTPLEDGCPLPPPSVAVMASRLMGRPSLVHLRSLELPEGRSEESRVGKECVRTGRYRW